jgi:rhamnosyltransferase
VRISVVIPTLNAGPDFAKLLDSLRRQVPNPPDEIIVIDSGSRDETCALAEKFGARIIPLTAPFNHGTTRDAGIAASTGDIVFLTVQDAVPAGDDYLLRVSSHFADPQVAGVTTRQIPPPNGPLELQIKAQLEARETSPGLPPYQGGIRGGALVRSSLADHPDYGKYTPAQRIELYRFDNVCSAVRRSVWEKIPFGHCRYAEDYQWAKKVIEAGHAIVRDPSAPVIHAHTRSFGYEFRRGLLDAWVLDEAFGYRYSLLKKLNRIGLLFSRKRPQKDTTIGKARSAGRWHAFKTYAAHALARTFYAFWRIVFKPFNLGTKTLTRLTSGI